MENLLNELADKRVQLDSLHQRMQEMISKVTQSPEYQQLLEWEQFAKMQVGELETNIRQKAVEVYRQTGNKKPHEGIGIRLMTKVIYDEALVTAWCMHQLPSALTVDKKIFEKVVKELPSSSIPSYVTIEESPTATIASDLSAWQTAPKA